MPGAKLLFLFWPVSNQCAPCENSKVEKEEAAKAAAVVTTRCLNSIS